MNRISGSNILIWEEVLALKQEIICFLYAQLAEGFGMG